jgi:hypothetical protein
MLQTAEQSAQLRELFRAAVNATEQVLGLVLKKVKQPASQGGGGSTELCIRQCG